MRFLYFTLVLALSYTLLNPQPGQAQAPVSVSLPDLTGVGAGGSVDIPIRLDEAVSASRGVDDYSLTLHFDASQLVLTGARNTGTLTDSWSISTSTPGSGQFEVVSSHASPLDGGAGRLVVLEAAVQSGARGSAPLTLDIQFNTGTPEASITHGNISIGNDLVITEIHADPAAGLAGDANGDGTRSFDDDEFIEVVNVSPSSIDIGGYSLSETDFGSPRYTFPTGTVLGPNTAVVVFGGGDPAGVPGMVFTTTSLRLDNEGETVTLSDNSGRPIDAVTYGDEGGDNQSITRDPGFLDPFVQHTEASAGVRFSPGQKPNGDPLPVEFTVFGAVAKGSDVTLRWSTASETNNSGFVVQHNVQNVFRRVGFVEGRGTTSRPQSYAFQVKDVAAGTHRFRLKQVDYDGAAEYSREVEVTIPLEEPFEMEGAYPNPFQRSATLTLQVKKTQGVSVTLYNALGQQVRNLYRGSLPSGEKQMLAIDGAGLPSGVYIYRVQGETFSEARQITHVE